MIQIKPLKYDNNAVVGIITAILIVGLFVTVFATVQTVYVPQWMEENEATHLQEVKNQFMQLKFALDIQVYNPEKSEMKLTTPITLGSEKVPYFLSEKSYGEIKIDDDAFQIEITGNDSTIEESLNTLYYQSQNSYYPDQRFTYETGGVILSQSEGSLLVSSPFLSIIESNENISFNWTIINITSIGGKRSAHGSSTCSILSQYTNRSETRIDNVSEIQINTAYPLVWKRYLNDTLQDKGLIHNTNYTISVQSDSILLTLLVDKQVNWNINKVNVIAQITPGWII